MKNLRALSKLATFFIKYNINETWMKVLMNFELSEENSKQISENNYLESLIFRQGEKAYDNFEEELKKSKIRY